MVWYANTLINYFTIHKFNSFHYISSGDLINGKNYFYNYYYENYSKSTQTLRITE